MRQNRGDTVVTGRRIGLAVRVPIEYRPDATFGVEGRALAIHFHEDAGDVLLGQRQPPEREDTQHDGEDRDRPEHEP